MWLRKKDDIANLTNYLDIHLGILNVSPVQHAITMLDIQLEQDGCNQADIKRNLEESSSLVATVASAVRAQSTLVQTSSRTLGILFSMINGDMRASLTQVVHLTQKAW